MIVFLMFSLNPRCKPMWVWGESLYFNYKKKNKRNIIFDRPRLIIFKKIPVLGREKNKNKQQKKLQDTFTVCKNH